MNSICIDEIKDSFVLNKDQICSNSKIYTGTLNGKNYTFKNFYFSDEYMNRLDSLSSIKSKYIIQPEIIVKNRNNLNTGFLSETFCDSKTILELSNPKYCMSDKIKLLKIVKYAIKQMNSLGIIHTDLHPANILFRNNSVKICDIDGCGYLYFEPYGYNEYSRKYLKYNNLSSSVDIYNFNIDVMCILYNICWNDIFKFSFVFEDKLNCDQKRIWQKVKTQESLTSKDFLIDYY